MEKFSWIDIRSVDWIGRIHIEYFMGIDGLSAPMVLLTALISCVAVVSSWNIEKWFQGQDQVELAGTKKTTLVVFWEEWCPHCKREVPKVQQIYTDLKAQGLQVLGLTKVSRSSTEDKVQSFITDNKIDYPIAKENGELSTYFNVSGIPAAAVLKDGKVVWRGHPAQLTEDRLKSWLWSGAVRPIRRRSRTSARA